MSGSAYIKCRRPMDWWGAPDVIFMLRLRLSPWLVSRMHGRNGRTIPRNSWKHFLKSTFSHFSDGCHEHQVRSAKSSMAIFVTGKYPEVGKYSPMPMKLSAFYF